MSACGRLTGCPDPSVGPRHRGSIHSTEHGHDALARLRSPAYAARKRCIMTMPVVSPVKHNGALHATSSDHQQASEQPDQDAERKKAGKLKTFVSTPAFWMLLLEHSAAWRSPE